MSSDIRWTQYGIMRGFGGLVKWSVVVDAALTPDVPTGARAMPAGVPASARCSEPVRRGAVPLPAPRVGVLVPVLVPAPLMVPGPGGSVAGPLPTGVRAPQAVATVALMRRAPGPT